MPWLTHLETLPRFSIRQTILALLMLNLSWPLRAQPKEHCEPHQPKPCDADVSKLPEGEFVASTSFRSASFIQPIWHGLNFEGHYFGGQENNVGTAGGSWTFRGNGWTIAPGFGAEFGDNGFHTMPALTVKWGFEHSWFVTQGLYDQGLGHTRLFPQGTEPEPGHRSDDSVVPSIADGNHLSARWKRVTAGGTWEHMQFREGREWKGGVRVAYRIFSHVSLTTFVMGPDTEIRGGVLFEPETRD